MKVTTSDVLDSEAQTPSSGTLGSETLSPTYSEIDQKLKFDKIRGLGSDIKPNSSINE